MTVSAYCSTTVKGWGIECLTPSNDNAVVVTQTSSIPTTFARVIGINDCAYLRDGDGGRAWRAAEPRSTWPSWWTRRSR